MPIIREMFVSDWDEPQHAIAAREQRTAQLQAQGMVCTLETCYRITDGVSVLLLEAREDEPIEVEDAKPTKRRVEDVRPRRQDGKPRRTDRPYRQVELR